MMARKKYFSEISGLKVVQFSNSSDNRGSFQKISIPSEFSRNSSDYYFCTSTNITTGTIRGLHMQLNPASEKKFVFCQSGEIYDVLLDLRIDSPTFGFWTNITLSSSNMFALQIPEGIAHGYQTLKANSQVSYIISGSYRPEASIRINPFDRDIGITWPKKKFFISEHDLNGSDFRVIMDDLRNNI